jgi:chemotaxis regulatin CheY-phosphate phosphatase CheZ
MDEISVDRQLSTISASQKTGNAWEIFFTRKFHILWVAKLTEQSAERVLNATDIASPLQDAI